MTYKKILAATALAGVMAACQSSENISVADYCADPARAAENVCQLNVEINGTRTALSETDLRLADAREMADSAMTAAKGAQARADDAMHTAESALAAANAIDSLYCETNTINQTDTGSCPADFRLVSCTQTRYTHRAGGLSFLREIDDKSCRVNARVLEMKVRCCTVASTRGASATSAAFTPAPKQITSHPTPDTAQRVYNQTVRQGF